MKIIQWPDARLRAKARHVTPDEMASAEFTERVEEMATLMSKHGGLGLSAPQVDWPVRVVLLADIDTLEEFKADPRGAKVSIHVLVNPVIVEPPKSEPVLRAEGCLSFCDKHGRALFVTIKQKEDVTLAWQDRGGGGEVRARFEGLEARCALHELDHLEGRTLVDRLGTLQRREFVQRLFKGRR
jgi:peptide deformylase